MCQQNETRILILTLSKIVIIVIKLLWFLEKYWALNRVIIVTATKAIVSYNKIKHKINLDIKIYIIHLNNWNWKKNTIYIDIL